MPTTGAVGVAGCAIIIMFAENDEIHPAALVTLYEYVPVESPEKVVLVPDPEIAPGLIVQVPAGKLVKFTLPVLKEQVGGVIVPTVGAEGVTG